MANILSDTKKQQVIALGQLGWTLRRIEAATGVRRETAGAYLRRRSGPRTEGGPRCASTSTLGSEPTGIPERAGPRMSFITVGHCAAASRASAANGIWPLPSCVTPSWLSSMTANLFRETH